MSARTPLERLFRPESIAVVGGGEWCEAVIRACQNFGFAGSIMPVHPVQSSIVDLPAYATVDALPIVPDATFIGINRDATLDVLRALSEHKAGGAVCFANGFAECDDDDGFARQAALVHDAGELAVLGPNCYGFINALDGAALWPDQHGCQRVDRGVAVMTQSSNIALNISMQRRGLPLGMLVTTGNQAQTDFAAVGSALLEDESISVLGLHVEGFGDIRGLERLAAQAAACGKSIVVLKVGRSREAQRATMSHTASLAGSDAGAAALMERLGLVRVNSSSELLETLKLLHVHGPLPGSALASLSCSGGEASLIADAAESVNNTNLVPCDKGSLVFPPLGEQRHLRLSDVLGSQLTLANPLDYDTGIWRDEAALVAVMVAMTGDDIALTLLLLDYPRVDSVGEDWLRVTRAVEQAAVITGARFAVLASLPENLPEAMAVRLIAAGIAPLAGFDDALKAIALAAQPGRKRQEVSAPVLMASVPESTCALSETEAKQQLNRYGLRVPKAEIANSPADAGVAADLIGYPVVLKGDGIAHKTEAGAVVLQLLSHDAVVAAAESMPAEKFLLEAMIEDVVAELLVGIVLDTAHGYVLTMAAGGTLTELLTDRQTLLVPASDQAIDEALSRLRLARVIDGYRGKSGANRSAIIAAIRDVQNYVITNTGKVSEVEINPLVCTQTEAIAVDALIIADADYRSISN